MKVSIVFALLSICGFMTLTSCASTGRELLAERQEQNHSRPAGYTVDGFILDNRMPVARPQRSWEFYYKNCTLVSRNPYPDRDEYSCSDPF
jgi:hypothetical protein